MGRSARRSIIALAFVAGCTFAGGSPAVSDDGMHFIAVPGLGIFAEGKIEPTTPAAFEAFMREQNVGDNQEIYLSSPGGDVGGGLGLGMAVRKKRFSTHVGIRTQVANGDWIAEPSGCHSACVYVFLGGETRIMHPRSQLGIHQMSVPRGADVDIHAVQTAILYELSYVRSMGASVELVHAMLYFPGRVHILTQEELEAWSVVTGGASPQPELAAEPEGEQVVRNFYLALGAGNGTRASQFVIPEKRTSGPLSANALTGFYSSLAKRLHLTNVESLGGNIYRADYTWRARNRHCNGSAFVTVVQRGQQALIEGIKATC